MNESYKDLLINSGLLKKVPSRPKQYRACCPYCADKHYHLYMFIDVGSEEPVVYQCKRCPNVHGVLNEKLLADMGLDIRLPKNIKSAKRLKVDSVSDKINIITVEHTDDFSGAAAYINSRVGHVPTLEELQMFQYVGNPVKYAKDYLGDKELSMLKDRFWFKLNNGNITGRIRDDSLSSYRWLMYRSTRITRSGLYQMKTPIDILNPINVVIAEGVMDVVGLYYNFKELENCSYIAVCSKNYSRGMQHMINKGIYGETVNIHIFKDPNVKSSDIYIDNNMRRLFNKVFIYGNGEYDYGVKSNLFNIRKVEKR